MKRLTLLAAIGISALAQPASPPPAMKAVYILPMSGGLDAYLADQIVRDHVLRVVADPSLADAVLTDALGTTFEKTLADLLPRKGDADKAANSGKTGGTENVVHPFRKTAAQGTLFLVDTKTREVIWSDYEKPPRYSTVSNLNREAARVVKKLKTTMK